MEICNTELFAPAANEYRKNKNKYTTLKVDSIPYRQLRRREEYRRRYGFSAPCLQDEHGNIRNVRITGTYYNFLNYIRMEQLDTSSIVKGKVSTARKKYDFPLFIDAQFGLLM